MSYNVDHLARILLDSLGEEDMKKLKQEVFQPKRKLTVDEFKARLLETIKMQSHNPRFVLRVFSPQQLLLVHKYIESFGTETESEENNLS